MLSACRPDCAGDAGHGQPIVLFVTVDTLRADHLGSYGNRRVRTAALDRLAAEGIRFERAYAASNTTLPSHTSLFTSLPVARHGVISNARVTLAPLDTVQSRFRDAGYRTAAFVSAYHLGPASVFGTLLPGLERYEAPRRVSRPTPATATVDATLDWLRGGACRGPAFAWIHLWDPHMPYAPPRPFDAMYYAGNPSDPAARSLENVQYDWALLDTSKARERLWRHPAFVRDLKRRLHVSSHLARRIALSPAQLRARAPDRETYDALFGTLRPILTDMHRTLPFNPALAGWLVGVRDVEYPRALYAGEVSYVDAELGRLVATLDDWGLRDRLVVVVTGDHGEGLGEHAIYFNHIGLWEEMVHVPLVVWAPGRVSPAVRTDLASGLDVAPTLLRLMHLDVPPTMEGHDLLGSGAPRDAVVAEAPLGLQVMLRAGDWKLLRTLHDYYATTAFHREAGAIELYDLAHDPDERTNLASGDPVRLAEMQARLDGWMATHGVQASDATPAPVLPPVPPAERDRLRALGYVE
jgi:arylsulfatase A-like enzyme